MSKLDKSVKRLYQVRVKLNEAKDRELREFQEKVGMKRATLVRKLIREGIGQGPDLHGNELAVIQNTVLQISAVGRNLNQLTRAVLTIPSWLKIGARS